MQAGSRYNPSPAVLIYSLMHCANGVARSDESLATWGPSPRSHSSLVGTSGAHRRIESCRRLDPRDRKRGQTTSLCGRLTRSPLQRTCQLGDGSDRKALARDLRDWSVGGPRPTAPIFRFAVERQGGVLVLQSRPRSRERGRRRCGWLLRHASEGRVRLQVVADRAASKHVGSSRNRGKGGQPVWRSRRPIVEGMEIRTFGEARRS